MGKHKRKFIDKKKDVIHTFKIVARSQRDPLIADETAPQSVLVDKESVDTNKAEQQKYGIYFDDDYDYLQHLRGVKEAIDWEEADVEVYTIRSDEPRASKNSFKDVKLVLPSSAFESYVEEPVGLLNKAAPITGPQPDLDPDVVAELDTSDIEDDCYDPSDENALPDDFVTLMNSEEPIEFDDDDDPRGLSFHQENNYSIYRFQQENLAESCSENDESEDRESINSDFNVSSDEERDELGSLPSGPCKTYRSQGTKSSFTEYSLSSSVIPRSELLSQLDDHFESKFLKEYDDDYVGALDTEDIDGYINEDSPAFTYVIERTKSQIKELKDDDLSRITQWIRDTEALRQDEVEEKELVEVPIKEEEGEKWDCESILSTYSNLYNHPKCISEIPSALSRIQIDPKTGLPKRRQKSLTKKALSKLDDENDDSKREADVETLLSTMSAISIRPPGETPEERRIRKTALKELRRERRIEKKLNKLAFKEEKKIQEKNNYNNRYSKKVVVS